jgi:thymidylate synthase (FAD)
MYKLYEDYAAVELVAYTQPNPKFVERIKAEGVGDLNSVQDFIAFCARVSNPGNQFNSLTSKKLINTLIKYKHWSPLEMADAILEIDTVRDIGRQIIRHKSFTPQEFSQRYEDVTKDFDGRGMKFVLRQARRQDLKNRQNSIDDIPEDVKRQWLAKQAQLIHEVDLAYKWALDNNIAKECARVILPEGNTGTRIYLKGSLRSWIHYISLRSGNGTQLEHILIAKACAEAISNIFPMIDDFVEREN